MFSTLKKLKQKIESATDEKKNQASIEVQPVKTEAELIKKKISKFLSALEDVAYDLHDDSSFYSDMKYSKKGEKKRDVACETYGEGYSFAPILQVDTTPFGKGNKGMMFATDGIYIGESDGCTYFRAYEDIIGSKFKTDGGRFYINNHEYEFLASKQMKKLKPVISLLNAHLS